MNKQSGAFTLIELSIVLIIIGLVVGGVLVGRDLISASAVRAQISQIEKYQQAVNTFKGKYGYLPGDIPDPEASQFGFVARGVNPGQGDGNSQLEGVYCVSSTACHNGAIQSKGETPVFWVDLSTAKLIDGNFTTANMTTLSATLTTTSSPGLKDYFPQARLGAGNYVYAYSETFWTGSEYQKGGNNYFGISVLTSVTSGLIPYSQPGMTVSQARDIDKKIDDGLPQVGNVLAKYINYNNQNDKGWWVGTSDTSATAGSSTTCYDNGNVVGTQQYSITQNSGAGVNCALSIRFQ